MNICLDISVHICETVSTFVKQIFCPVVSCFGNEHFLQLELSRLTTTTYQYFPVFVGGLIGATSANIKSFSDTPEIALKYSQ